MLGTTARTVPYSKQGVRKKGKVLTLWSLRILVGIMSGLIQPMYILKVLVGVTMRMALHRDLLMMLQMHQARYVATIFHGQLAERVQEFQLWLKMRMVQLMVMERKRKTHMMMLM
jgi:hypothetical protein